MADTEDDFLKEAIAGTELEIFGDATGKELPSTEGGPGDRSVEEMGAGLEGQTEAEETDSDLEARGEGDAAAEKTGDDDADKGKDATAKKDPETGKFVAKTKAEKDAEAKVAEAADKTKDQSKARVPLSDLQTERKGRQAAEARVKEIEAERDTERKNAADELKRINQRLDDIAAGRQAAPKQDQPTAAAKKDIFEDPDGFVADLRADLKREADQKFINADFARTAEDKPEKFEAAYKALTSLDKNDPQARATVKSIWDSPTPGSALLRWHGRQEVQRTVGDDPEAFAEKVRAEEREKLAKDPEFRKQLLVEMQADARASEGGTPRHVARMPKSLNGAAGGQSGGSGAVVDGSDKGVFADAFAD